MTPRGQFVICIGNKGYAASLELRKIYQLIPGKNASRLHQLRVGTQHNGFTRLRLLLLALHAGGFELVAVLPADQLGQACSGPS